MRKWIVAGVVLLLVLLMAALLMGPTLHSFVRERTQKVLQTHFASAVEFSDFDVTMFPRLRVTITGLALRHKGRMDIPPLIEVKTVSIHAQPAELPGFGSYISFVQLDGLQIHTPPRVAGGEPLIRKTDAIPEYVAALDKYGMFEHEPSREPVSRESFMKTLKREEMYTNRYNDLEQLRTNIEEFIEEYYNRQRLHSAFGYRSPEEFERQSEQVHRAESLGANVQFIVNDGNGENEERISTELSREGDSNAIPFPRPLLLLPDAAKAESKSACVPNFFSHNRGTSQRIGNKRGTKWEQNTEEHP